MNFQPFNPATAAQNSSSGQQQQQQQQHPPHSGGGSGETKHLVNSFNQMRMNQFPPTSQQPPPQAPASFGSYNNNSAPSSGGPPPPMNNSYNQFQPQGLSSAPPTSNYQQSQPPPTSNYQQQQSQPPPTSNYQQQQSQPPPTSNYQQQQSQPPPTSNYQQQQSQPPPTSNYQQQQSQPPPTSNYQQSQPPMHPQQMQGHNFSNLPPTSASYHQPQQQPPMQQPQPSSQMNNGNVGELSEQAKEAQCDPDFMRLTVTSIPHSQENASKSKLAFGVIIRPLCNKENKMDVVNFGPSGVVRCKRCRTYINPFAQWVDNGRRWRCNICGVSNEVNSSYFCHLDGKMLRTDRKERPELRSGSVEIEAPAEYMMRPPQPPVYMVVLDVSVNSIQSGMLNVAVETIKHQLDTLLLNPRSRFGLVTFDSHVHFYNLNSSLSTPQMMVVPDISELFIPIPDDLLVNLSESRDVIDSLLDMLPTMHSQSRNVETALGPAIRAAFRVMQSIGGKMMVFQSTLPSLGQGALKHRENNRLFGTDREHTLLQPAENFYRQTAIEFCRQQVSVDMFLFGSQYSDVASLASLAKFSAGQLFCYPNFNASSTSQRAKFAAELRHCMNRESGWEAVMRVRCTQGMRLANFYGNSFLRGPDLLALPNVNADSVFAVEIVHSDALLSASVISVQAALLYTTSEGERRIRVHTIAAPVSKLYTEIFRTVDVDALCNLMAKSALETALKSGLESARLKLQNTCSEIVAAYRRSGAYSQQYQSQQQHNQLALPPSLELFPLYIMALMKNPAFRGGVDLRSDERTFLIYALNNMSANQSRVFIYPRMFALHDMAPDCGTIVDNQVKLPLTVNLSVERLVCDGVFLLEDSLTMYLWLGKSVNAQFLLEVFGVNSLDSSSSEEFVETIEKLISKEEIELETAIATRLGQILKAIRAQRNPFMGVVVIKEGEASEGKLFWKLVEDRASFSGGSYSYGEFLNQINRQSLASNSRK